MAEFRITADTSEAVNNVKRLTESLNELENSSGFGFLNSDNENSFINSVESQPLIQGNTNFNNPPSSFVNSYKFTPITESLTPNKLAPVNPQEMQSRLQFIESINSVNDNISSLINELKKNSQTIHEETNSVEQENPFINPGSSKTRENFTVGDEFRTAATVLSHGTQIASAIDSGYIAYQQKKLAADYIGAEASGWQSAAGVLSGISGAAAPLVAMGGIPGLVAGVTSLVTGAAGAGARMIGNHRQLDEIKKNMGMDLVESFDPMTVAFGIRETADNVNWHDNYQFQQKAYRDYIQTKNIGLGISDKDFINFTSQMARNGITDIDIAGDYVRQAGITARNTDTDINSIMSVMGTISRYGGNGIDAIQFAQKAALESGLNNTQFTEFLNGIQKSMEDGISKGFIRSSDDIATNLVYLSTISGNNPLWQGEQGAMRYNQMTSSMTRATSLSDTASMLLYRVAGNTMNNELQNKSLEDILGKNGFVGNGSYLDTMAYIEKGNLSPEFMQNLHNTVSTAYGNDKEAIVETYRQMFGLNYEGSIQLYNMLQNPSTTITKESIQQTVTDNQTDTTKTFQSAITAHMNDVNNELRNIEDVEKLIAESINDDLVFYDEEQTDDIKNGVLNSLEKNNDKANINGGEYYGTDTYFDEVELKNALNYYKNKGQEENYNNLLKNLMKVAESDGTTDKEGNPYYNFTKSSDENGVIDTIVRLLQQIAEQQNQDVEAVERQ